VGAPLTDHFLSRPEFPLQFVMASLILGELAIFRRAILKIYVNEDGKAAIRAGAANDR
jgi:hypothetical protein